jgi:hypothetical protein
MQIPCALCKKTKLPDNFIPANEDLPLCSGCLKEYGDVLQYAFEQALYEHFKYHDRRSYSITLESLHRIAQLASKYAASLISGDDLYLTGMYLRYLYAGDFVSYSHKELLYHLVALSGKKISPQ